MIAAILDGLFRREYGRVLAAVLRRVRDLDLAEDAVQDALARALAVWPRSGLPDNPAAWLTTAAHRRAIDLVRQRGVTPADPVDPPATTPPVEQLVEPLAAVSGVEDDRLRLLFMCCHPSINPPAQVALALRTLGGLSTRDIARGFVEPEATTAQRLVRAKQKIRATAVPFDIPRAADLPERLAGVLSVVYLIFNEGYTATDAPSLLRPDLCAEAIRLGRLLAELMPGEPEAGGLLALMLLTDARRPARTSDTGELVPLEDQDRSRWHRGQIDEGVRALDAALLHRNPGPYQIQAAIAALHATAPTAADTDWRQISLLYTSLLRHTPTPVVELNAAVATAMAVGIDAGLERIAAIEDGGQLAGYHLLPAAKADLLRRAGRPADAEVEYRRAITLATNPTERAYLERRLGEVTCGAPVA